MSDGYRNGAFALGLVVGGGIALKLILWLDYKASQPCKEATDACQQQEYSQVGSAWDGIIGTFISPSDTLAQRTMALFTIAATGVLILTLRSANKTNRAAIKASEAALMANDITREAQRPWVDCEISDFGTFQKVGGAIIFFPRISITNHGASPAVRVYPRVTVSPAKSFNNDTAREELLAKMGETRSSSIDLVIFPGQTFVFEKWGMQGLDRAQDAVGANHLSSETGWWFTSIVMYEFGGDSHFTCKIYRCAEPDFAGNDFVQDIPVRKFPVRDIFT